MLRACGIGAKVTRLQAPALLPVVTVVLAPPVLASNPLVKRVTWPPVEVAVKFLPAWLAPLMVTLVFVGENVYPLRLGFTV